MLSKYGIPRRRVLRLLFQRVKEDLTFDSGRILSSMCTKPHVFAAQVYCKYLEKNLGDPGLFPGTANLEGEAIRMLGSLLSNPDAHGHIVSGGTEANIMALWAARNSAKVERPEVIAPITAHFSFDKAADILGVKLVKVKVDDSYRLDLGEVKKMITKRTILFVGVAGTTNLGVVDPISELSEMAEACSIPLHVDASFGGFVLPFLGELGYEAPDFDFRLKGVSSISVDPHKMGMAPIPGGGILFRKPDSLMAIGNHVTYLSGGPTVQNTVLATRPGAAAIAVWALMKMMGRSGFRRVVKRCMGITHFLCDEVTNMRGTKPLIRPTLNILGISPTSIESHLLADALRRRGWALSLYPGYIRIVLMPHLRRVHIERFIKDLHQVVEERC